MPAMGLRRQKAKAWPAFRPASSALGSPGPRVTATASNPAGVTDAWRNASAATGMKLRKCSRVANSGTTPPYSAWMAVCDATTLDRTRPSRIIATPVSSQEVSMARRVMSPGHQAAWRSSMRAMCMIAQRTKRSAMPLGSGLTPISTELRPTSAMS